jgi:RNA polymerase sigma-70 factor (ECF subfamily)
MGEAWTVEDTALDSEAPVPESSGGVEGLAAFEREAGRVASPAAARALATILVDTHAQGARLWPDVPLTLDGWAGHLGKVLPELVEAPEKLLELQVGDLYLAGAALSGAQVAQRALDAHLGPPVDRQLQHLGLDADGVSEVRQELRLKLLLGRQTGPALLDYKGSTDLRTWARVVASRMAIDLQRARSARPRLLPDEQLAAAANLPGLARRPDDAEHHATRRERRQLLLEALGEAIAGLSERERALLRLHHVGGASIDALAPTYGVHRTTVARWLVAAQERLGKALDRALLARDMSLDERRSVLDTTMSQLDLSLGQLFKDESK